jgi:uncharacterized damage-inducible protein DinB/predicted RNase H-like HicB family nuclease
MMHRKPTYRVFVEEGAGSAMAHVAELPGCFTAGSSASKVVAATPRAIRDFLVWLRTHREPLVPEAHVSRPNLADILVVEVRTKGVPLQAGSKAALFDFDEVPWDDEKLERTLRWLGYSRADLLAAVEGISGDEMKAKQVSPDRTLWDTLRHVADAEYGYIRRVAGPLDVVTDDQPSQVMGRLAMIRDIFERHARVMAADKRGNLVYATWAARPDEPWSLQKAVRRALEHELEHVRELRG